MITCCYRCALREHAALINRTTNGLLIALLQAFGGQDTTFGLAISPTGESPMAKPLTELFLWKL